MLTRIEALGNDLLVLGEVFSPTFLSGKMLVGGRSAQAAPDELPEAGRPASWRFGTRAGAGRGEYSATDIKQGHG